MSYWYMYAVDMDPLVTTPRYSCAEGADYSYLKSALVDDIIFDENCSNITISSETNGGTLQIEIDGDYTTKEEGYNLIVTTGKGELTIKDYFLNNDRILINDHYYNDRTWINDRDYQELWVEGNYLVQLIDNTSVTIRRNNTKYVGTVQNDSIKNYGYNSIYLGAGNDTIVDHGIIAHSYGEDGNDVIETYGSSPRVYGGAGKDKIYVYSATSGFVDGGSNNDIIYSKGKNIEIDGGTGNDKISLDSSAKENSVRGGKGNDTIYTAAKRTNGNIFLYNSGDGNDYVKNWNANDTLKVESDVFAKQTIGNDIIVSVGSGVITLQGAATVSSFNILGTEADNPTLKNIYDAMGSIVTADSDDIVVDASSRTLTVKIIGNAKNNSILGGSNRDYLYGGSGKDTLYSGKGNDYLSGGSGNDYVNGGAGNDSLYAGNGNDILIGGSGNDTISCGAGNDSLWGGTGYDKFIYKEGYGKDIIFDFDKNDMLLITGAFSGTYNKSKDEVYFMVGNTDKALTLKNPTATSFNINGISYKIKGTKIVEK